MSRGLSVALVEARDWASGTSSRSSKLIHGGLRYLEQRDFRLVREALRERGLLLTSLAPHLVRPVPFLFPIRRRVWERFYIGAGVGLYDSMGGGRSLPRHRRLSRRAALREAPALRPDALVGAIQYYDAQTDDARFTMTVARTAAQYGACVATRTEVTRFLREGERVTGALVRDLRTDREIAVRAQRVINATGVWTDGTREMAGIRGTFNVRASKGVHLVVPRDRIRLDTGLIIRTEKSVLFVIPWGRHWIVGTTDTAYDADAETPVADRADVDYLLERVNAVLRTPRTYEDAASHEGALSLEDVLSRRIRISIEEWDNGAAAAPHVAELIAPILGWDAGDVARETEAYLRLVRTEYGGRLRADGDTAPVAHASA